MLPVRELEDKPIVDADLQAAERDAAGDPGERLAREATPDERGEQLVVAGRAGEQLVRLLFRRDEPGARDQLNHSLEAIRSLHACN